MSTATIMYDVRDARHPLYLAGSGWGGSMRPLGEGVTTDEIMQTADLDWLVEQRPLYTREGGQFAAFEEVGSHVANVRRDTGTVLGVVGSGYRPAQNRTVLDVASEIVRSGEAR